MKWLALWIVLSSDATPPNEPVAATPPAIPANHDAMKATNERQPHVERSITDIRRAVRDALRSEAKAVKTTSMHKICVSVLINLHREIVAHSTFENGMALRESRSMLQSRLVRIERDIRREHEYPRRDANKSVSKPHRTPLHSDNTIKKQPTSVSERPVLAQVGRQGGNQPAGLLGGGQGQPRGDGFGQPAAGPNGQIPDFGPELADLIQQVIDPKSWNVNGGPGSIIYFQPLKALVVTATTEFHQNMAVLFGQMRDAQ